jgi:hypothetical protein
MYLRTVLVESKTLVCVARLRSDIRLNAPFVNLQRSQDIATNRGGYTILNNRIFVET